MWGSVLLLALLLAACNAPAAPATPTASDRPASAPTSTAPPQQAPTATPALITAADFAAFRERDLAARSLGAPLGPPLWVDSRLTQLFARGRLEARGAMIVVVADAAPPRVPSELLRLGTAEIRASMAAPGVAQPLETVIVTVLARGYDGPAELRLYDSRGRAAGVWPAELRDGIAEVPVTPRGALGTHAAVLLVGGKVAAVKTRLFVLDAQTTVRTGQPRFDELTPRVRDFMAQGVLEYELDDRQVRGYRSPDNPLLWLRDHVYQGRGFRYFERDVTSLLEAFARAQQPDGSLPDFLARPETGVLNPVRKQVEADVEFLFVQGVYEAWQMTGDDAWLAEMLPVMRRAVRYSMSDPLRWDAELQLVKRPYTIDMWDFEYGPTTRDPSNGRPAPRHWIDDSTIWGIFHGDNTGLAHALELLARAEERVGEASRADEWRAAAAGIMGRLNALSWNGRFFTHHVPLVPFDTPGVDEARQLSLSNAYALNRSVLRYKQAAGILDEYFQRGVRRGTTFAEWYSIDPPFPAGSYGLAGRLGEQPGEYLNGGIMPLVGGELARGAFRWGAERYGFANLHRYYFLVSTTGSTYLWYYPEGNPGISGVDTLPTDGWGASAMLGALIEGATGVEDRGALFRDVTIAPRWTYAEDVREALVVARYAASDGYVAYRWSQIERGVRLELAGSGEQAEVLLPLPDGIKAPVSVMLDGDQRPFDVDEFGTSRYVSLTIGGGVGGVVEVRW